MFIRKQPFTNFTKGTDNAETQITFTEYISSLHSTNQPTNMYHGQEIDFYRSFVSYFSFSRQSTVPHICRYHGHVFGLRKIVFLTTL